ncbi:hypothetical protein DPMN_187607 [Dreissena polymorpha]|uniref:Uncharacterized protein n=1 Tax=Dreissena polymorpha TaxID=45954 RepID=A0A9D4I975_DREPO|nr:hypothetical protein DPMN_187607 [Dreissena polymorpha]
MVPFLVLNGRLVRRVKCSVKKGGTFRTNRPGCLRVAHRMEYGSHSPVLDKN